MTLAALLLLSVIPALTPVPQNANPDSGWMKRHAKVLEQAKAGGSEVVFLGDSITQGWEGRGVQVWRKYFLDPPYRALNLGFSGDRTENVLWRIDHGELDGYKAKAIVLMIGTNNGGCAESVEGTKRIVALMKKTHPEAKILLLPIFPMGEKPGTKTRRQRAAASARYQTEIVDGKTVFWHDFNAKLLTSDGTLTKDMAPDGVHPGVQGYDIWAAEVLPFFRRLCGK